MWPHCRLWIILQVRHRLQPFQCTWQQKPHWNTRSQRQSQGLCQRFEHVNTGFWMLPYDNQPCTASQCIWARPATCRDPCLTARAEVRKHCNARADRHNMTEHKHSAGNSHEPAHQHVPCRTPRRTRGGPNAKCKIDFGTNAYA